MCRPACLVAGDCTEQLTAHVPFLRRRSLSSTSSDLDRSRFTFRSAFSLEALIPFGSRLPCETTARTPAASPFHAESLVVRHFSHTIETRPPAKTPSRIGSVCKSSTRQ